MPAEKHFNVEPWFVVDAETDEQHPFVSRFRTRKAAIDHATIRAYENKRIYHVFLAERQASVHPQQPKIYDEAGVELR